MKWIIRIGRKIYHAAASQILQTRVAISILPEGASLYFWKSQAAEVLLIAHRQHLSAAWRLHRWTGNNCPLWSGELEKSKCVFRCVSVTSTSAHAHKCAYLLASIPHKNVHVSILYDYEKSNLRYSECVHLYTHIRSYNVSFIQRNRCNCFFTYSFGCGGARIGLLMPTPRMGVVLQMCLLNYLGIISHCSRWPGPDSKVFRWRWILFLYGI